MKALFQRFHRSAPKDRDKDRDSVADRDPTPSHKEKFLQLPPLPEWPPPPRLTSPPASIVSFKPLPDITLRPLPTVDEPLLPLAGTTSPSRSHPVVSQPANAPDDYITRTASSGSRTEADTNGLTSPKAPSSTNPLAVTNDTQRKVAFISPAPTPTPSNLDRALPDAPGNTLPSSGPVKTTLSRFQAAHGKEPRGSTSTTASASSIDIATSKASVKATSTRTATSPFPVKGSEDNASIDQYSRSGTPYSQMSNKNMRILAATSWSETAEGDLVSNLGARERTRQEVLFEILASEERYSQLIRYKALTHPMSIDMSPS
jgi:hypothetical protein